MPSWRDSASVSDWRGLSSSVAVLPTTTRWPSFSWTVWSIASTRTLLRMISLVWTSTPAAFSASLSRRLRITSTWSFGRMKPPAPVSGEISVEMARMPAGRIAAMKPEPLALMSLASRIGSPATNGVRAIEPANCWTASGLSLLRMKFGPAAAVGQVCHLMSAGATTWPMPISAEATRISTVSITAMGAGAGAAFSDLLARKAASPPAPTATTRTRIRAVFIRFTFHEYA